MNAHGIKGNLLLWIKDFFSKQVDLNGSASNTLTVSSEVPQGSVMGPLLFLVYVNDIPEQVECNSIFAVNTKIYTTGQFSEASNWFELTGEVV